MTSPCVSVRGSEGRAESRSSARTTASRSRDPTGGRSASTRCGRPERLVGLLRGVGTVGQARDVDRVVQPTQRGAGRGHGPGGGRSGGGDHVRQGVAGGRRPQRRPVRGHVDARGRGATRRASGGQRTGDPRGRGDGALPGVVAVDLGVEGAALVAGAHAQDVPLSRPVAHRLDGDLPGRAVDRRRQAGRAAEDVAQMARVVQPHELRKGRVDRRDDTVERPSSQPIQDRWNGARTPRRRASASSSGAGPGATTPAPPRSPTRDAGLRRAARPRTPPRACAPASVSRAPAAPRPRRDRPAGSAGARPAPPPAPRRPGNGPPAPGRPPARAPGRAPTPILGAR